MNVQEAVKQTLDIYADNDEYQSIDNAMDYLLQLMKADDAARIKKAVYNGVTNPQHETREPYMSGYRAGWNDSLHEITVALTDGVYGHHWLAQEIIKAKSKLVKV